MTTFLLTLDGELINTALINKIVNKDKSPGDEWAYAELTNGGGVWLDFVSVKSTHAALQPVLPAEPGFRLLTCYIGGPIKSPDDKLSFKSTPIVGWRWNGESTEPIVAGEEQVGYAVDVLCPDGRVLGYSRLDEPAWRKGQQKRWDEERQSKSK